MVEQPADAPTAPAAAPAGGRGARGVGRLIVLSRASCRRACSTWRRRPSARSFRSSHRRWAAGRRLPRTVPVAGSAPFGYHSSCRRSRIRRCLRPPMPDAPAPSGTPPRYRPRERFWPYADLPEQPTDEELAALDPDLHEALFGAPPRPFSITLVFPRFDVADFARAVALARASAEYRETGRRSGLPPSRAVLAERCAEAARSVRDRRGSSSDRSADRRSAGAVRARAVAAARLVSDSALRRDRRGRADRTSNAICSGSRRELRKLEAEYNMFFAGRLPKPPWETRSRVEALVKQLDRAHIQNYGDRFRFTTLQSRFAAFSRACGTRGLRAREEGRAGSVRAAADGQSRRQEGRGPRRCTSRRSAIPLKEMDKLHDLYDSLVDARRAGRRGRRPVPQVRRAGEGPGRDAARAGRTEVAFRSR